MRVLHLETGRHLYGGPRQVLYLLGGLTAEGIDNLLVCPEGSAPATQAKRDGLTVQEISFGGDADVLSVFRIQKLIQTFKPDLVHIHSRRGADSWGLIAAGWAGVPVVVSRRVDHVDPAWLANWRYRRVSRVVAISDVIRQVVLSQGVDEEKVVVVHSAVDVEEWTAPRRPEALRKEFSLPAGLPTVAMAAQFISRKGHLDLIQALVQPDMPSLAMVLFGQGPLEEEVRSAIVAAGLTDRVRMPGFRSDLPEWLSSFDMMAHPAHKEGLGVAVLQGSAAALPIVGCRAGGVPEIVIDGQTGILVPPGNPIALGAALKSLALDQVRAREMGGCGRTLVSEKFSVTAMVKGNLAVYRDVLGR